VFCIALLAAGAAAAYGVVRYVQHHERDKALQRALRLECSQDSCRYQLVVTPGEPAPPCDPEDPSRHQCPQCGKFSMIAQTRCPQCGGWFLSPRDVERNGELAVTCPHCKAEL
jgi:hypothetical protein